MDKDIVISVQEVYQQFNDQTVLQNVNIDFRRGEIHGIIGRNGSGKTVLLKCICGPIHPSSGKVAVNNKIVGKDIDFPQD